MTYELASQHEFDELLSQDQAAAMLKCSVRTIRRLRSVGALADIVMGPSLVRIPLASIEDFKQHGGLHGVLRGGR
jgi:excisionase family DNA binding protein